MAYRISQPLAATQFPDDKPKKKIKRRQVQGVSEKGGTIGKRITTKGGKEKTITTSRDGTKKTVEKVSRKGRVKSRTTEIDLAKGQVTTTKRKGGRVVKKKTSKELTPQQASQLSVSPGGLKSKVKSNVRRAERAYEQDDNTKARKKAQRKEERENRRYNPNKARRKQKQSNRKNKDRKLKTFKEIRTNIKDACKGKRKGTKKCPSARKRF